MDMMAEDDMSHWPHCHPFETPLLWDERGSFAIHPSVLTEAQPFTPFVHVILVLVSYALDLAKVCFIKALRAPP